ncbi:class I SAM-dependent methyltransferase [Ensifer adhaerens]|uniref:class I SAM-dependent methyltransferase n=1 Tax=Ensifer adhaerens TaxID=106592 RepID=UPI00098FD620|nr:class I SAM-dependent methyltransferase [Ensifer adhaerens]
MAQNVYDQPEFFEGYSQLGRSVHGLAGAAEWPAIRALLPDLSGKSVVDLGCGYGWFSRHAREAGAAQVLGLDLSEKMIARARADTSDAAIEHKIADLDQLELPEESFDFAYSSLAFHYVEDFGRLVATIHKALVPGAHFVFTIEHPIYMASHDPGWRIENGERTWPVDHYSEEGPRTTDWLAKGVIKHHRTIGTTLNTLIATGFAIRHVEEWRPTQEQIAEIPALAEEVDRPMILIMKVEK